MDEAAVESVARGRKLALPRVPHRGRLGDVRATSVGASMEIHDFRGYQPGDDLRQIDWNAVARTGELILRVREQEVSPRIEVVLDGSRSMEVSAQKAARAREAALLCCVVALRKGLAPALVVTSARPTRAVGSACPALLRQTVFDGRDDLFAALSRAPPLRPCGLRWVVSDFLFEVDLDTVATRLSRGAAATAFIQVLDPEDEQPTGGFGARLVDSESGSALDRILSAQVLSEYQTRLAQHQRLLQAAALRVRGSLARCSAGASLAELARGPLGPLLEGARG